MATHLMGVPALGRDPRVFRPPGTRVPRPHHGRMLPAVSRRRRDDAHSFCVTSSASSSQPSSGDTSSDGSMTVTTFNVLAPCYKRIKGLDGTVTMEAEDMTTALDRQTRVLDMLTSSGSAIICLQEFWHANDKVRQLYETTLKAAGYEIHVTPRTGNRPDGLLTAVKSKSFQVIEAKDVLFNDCGDRVATLMHLRPKNSFIDENDSDGPERYKNSGDLLIVNTHLLFPHNSNSTLIRLRESFKILEFLHTYQTRMIGEVEKTGSKTKKLPVVMCGDFNGTSRGSVARFLTSQGFISAFEACTGGCGNDPTPIEPEAQTMRSVDEHGADDSFESDNFETSCSNQTKPWISHLNHHGEVVGVDHIFVLNPTKQLLDEASSGPSWKTAIYAMIQAKMLEKGLGDNKKAFAFFDVDDDRGITREEFAIAVSMLDLTGEGTPGLIQSEIELLYDDCDKDGDGRVDFSEFIRKLDVETMEAAYKAIRASQDIEEGPWDVVGDLMATAASPTVLAGFTVDEDEFFESYEGSVDYEEVSELARGAVTVSANAPFARAAKGDLAVASAMLPESMQRGLWPEPSEFDLSDHGPLTAVLVPRT